MARKPLNMSVRATEIVVDGLSLAQLDEAVTMFRGRVGDATASTASFQSNKWGVIIRPDALPRHDATAHQEIMWDCLKEVWQKGG